MELPRAWLIVPLLDQEAVTWAYGGSPAACQCTV